MKDSLRSLITFIAFPIKERLGVRQVPSLDTMLVMGIACFFLVFLEIVFTLLILAGATIIGIEMSFNEALGWGSYVAIAGMIIGIILIIKKQRGVIQETRRILGEKSNP